MTKRSKREEKIRNNPNDVSLQDFEWLASQYGYIKEGAKHPQAIIGTHVMTYKRESPVKAACVKQLLGYI